jgi:hypothetical protein
LSQGRFGKTALLVALLCAPALAQSPVFTPGNLVVVVEGCGVNNGNCNGTPNGSGPNGGYGDNQAAPLNLFQYAPTGTTSVIYVNSLTLPQVPSGANFPVSGEYGSSSEGTLQLSGAGQYLTVMGYGVNAAAFNVNPPMFGAAPSNALGQSGSLTGQSYVAVPRVVALIDANGSVNTSTAIYNIYNTNNPRSIYTLDGVNAYVSGQGSGSDATGGVFLTPLGAINTAPTPISGLDTSNNTLSQDTRDVQIVNNTLYVSVDTKEGSNAARSFVATLGTPGTLPTSAVSGGPIMLNGFGNTGGTGKVSITTGANSNGNGLNAGAQINVSPVNFFFANTQTLYVADSGNGKQNSATSSVGNGGLEKWVNTKADGSGTWNLQYTLHQNLPLVLNSSASGTTGLYGLAGRVSADGTTVDLFATNYTIQDTDSTFLYGITDTIAFTTASQAAGEIFTQLAAAPTDSNFKGVSFAPKFPTGGVEITSSPSGLTFTSSGVGCALGTYPTPQAPVWTPGSSCTLSVTSPQAGPTGVQYTFSQWDDGSTNTSRVVTAPGSTTTYTATFTTNYLLTTSAGAGGSVSAGGFFAAGSNATITASPAPGFYFVNFTGTTTSTTNPLVLPMNAPQTITATFAPQIKPTITWPAIAAVTFGSALSGSQLNATANVPGTFVYNPPAGTVLPVGNSEPLSVTFTPTDTNTYTAAMASNTITVNAASQPASPANLVVTKTLTRSADTVTVQLTITNAGGTAAANVMVTSVKVGADLASPLPQSIGTIAAGASAQVTVTVPASVGASGAASSLVISGSYTGGTFSSSARITLP